MLEELSRQVFHRLELTDGLRVLDLGCGLDFTALDLPADAYDAAFSIEACCHAPGSSMKRSAGLPRWYAALLGYMTRSWAVERFADMPEFKACLQHHGFDVLAAEDISWRIAPSVLHVPRVTRIGLGRSYFGYYLVTARKR